MKQDGYLPLMSQMKLTAGLLDNHPPQDSPDEGIQDGYLPPGTPRVQENLIRCPPDSPTELNGDSYLMPGNPEVLKQDGYLPLVGSGISEVMKEKSPEVSIQHGYLPLVSQIKLIVGLPYNHPQQGSPNEGNQDGYLPPGRSGDQEKLNESTPESPTAINGSSYLTAGNPEILKQDGHLPLGRSGSSEVVNDSLTNSTTRLKEGSHLPPKGQGDFLHPEGIGVNDQLKTQTTFGEKNKYS